MYPLSLNVTKQKIRRNIILYKLYGSIGQELTNKLYSVQLDKLPEMNEENESCTGCPKSVPRLI